MDMAFQSRGDVAVEASSVMLDISSGSPAVYQPKRPSAMSVTTVVVRVDKVEEEEDIDILDVDEEEEANVKKAMGVGEALGLPPAPAPIAAADVVVDAAPSNGPDAAEHNFFASGAGSAGEEVLGFGSAIGHAHGIPLVCQGQEGVETEGEEAAAQNMDGGVRAVPMNGMGVPLVDPSAAFPFGALEGEDSPGAGVPLREHEHEGGADFQDFASRQRRRRRPSAGVSSPSGSEVHPGHTPGWQLPNLQGVAKKTRQRVTRPANVQSFSNFVLHQEPRTPAQARAEQDGTVGGVPKEAHRRASSARRAARQGSWAFVDNPVPTPAPPPRGSRRGGFDKAVASPPGAAPLIQFSIRSIVVPELTVCLSEDATVGSLKQAVAEATLAALGGGARLRMLVQGTRVRDDDATLAEIGLSQAGGSFMTDPDYLSFMMEPAPPDSQGPLSPEQEGPTSDSDMDMDPALLLSRLSAPGRLQRTKHAQGAVFPQAAGRGGKKLRVHPESTPTSPSTVPTRQAAAQAMAAIRAQAQGGAAPEQHADVGSPGLGSDGDLPETAVGSGDRGPGLSASALMVHPSAVQDALSLPPGQRTPMSRAIVARHRSASSMQLVEHRRRIRRPFTVQEVGTLVDAVETLGAREMEVAPLTSAWWREVKDFAFADSRHRTYVDLKDKWKTLVHTAQIAPHQRRGDPVPQELLDRVMQAHALWTEQLRSEREDR